MTLAERRRMNTYTETARTAMARALQLCATSARIATIPPAPTPATKPVTASPARAETGTDEDREDQGRIAVPLPVFDRRIGNVYIKPGTPLNGKVERSTRVISRRLSRCPCPGR
jgi:hypothetical protein